MNRKRIWPITQYGPKQSGVVLVADATNTTFLLWTIFYKDVLVVSETGTKPRFLILFYSLCNNNKSRWEN